MSKNRPAMLFLNIAWMKYYDGPRDDDPTRGNFRWLLENPNRHHGHECYNFRKLDWQCRGCHPGGKGTNIEKLGGNSGVQSVEHVLVVWFSRDPRIDKAVIVGWYQDATVYRDFQKPTAGDGPSLYGEQVWYKAKAKFENCKMVPVPERCFPIPSRHEIAGGYGQNPNWYGLNDKFREKVWQYIQNYGKNRDNRHEVATKSPRNDDHEMRKRIEDTAIRVATEYYESPTGGSRNVKSVETECKGWDLEAVGSTDTLLVEVKGLGGSNPIAELTPNEYEKMRKLKQSWVLLVVTNCLSEVPRLYEFRYMYDAKCWESQHGQALQINEKTAAIVSLNLG